MASQQKPITEPMSSFLKFVAEKTNGIQDYPFIAEWIEEYKKEHNCALPSYSRINQCRNRISEIEEFDEETKVRVMFALNAQLDASFLDKLKVQADVEVDRQNRIIFYKKHGGGLELSEQNLTKSAHVSQMLEFLAEKTKTVNTPTADNLFMEEFKIANRYKDTIPILGRRFEMAKNQIYRSDVLDKNTKVRMMFISNMVIRQSFLEELQEDANVIVDDKGRIRKYTAVDGSLELRGSPGTSSDRWRNTCKNFDKDFPDEGVDDEEKERIQLIKFLIKEIDKETPPTSVRQLATDFSNEEYGSLAKMHRVWNQISTFRKHIHHMVHIDMGTKAKLILALDGSVTEEFLKELRKDADVEINNTSRIICYKSKDGSVHLEERATQDSNLPSRRTSGRVVPKRKIGTVNEHETKQEEMLEDDQIPPITRRTLRSEFADADPLPEYDEMEDVKYPIDVYASARIGNSSTSRRSETEDFDYSNNIPTSSEMLPRQVKEEPKIELESEEILSLNQFLQHFYRSVSTLYAPELVTMKQRMEEMMKNEDKTIPTPCVHQFLEGYLQNLRTADGNYYGAEQLTSLSNVLYQLDSQMGFVAHPLTNRFQENLRRLIEEAAYDNETVPFARIRYALEMALDAVDLWIHESQ